MSVTVSIGGFVADLEDRSRVTLNLTGWTDAAPTDSAIEPRGQQDGGWDGTGFLRPRVVTVEGLVDVGTHVEAMTARDQLASLAPASLQQFVVEDVAAGTRSSLMRVTLGAVLEWLTAETFTYSMQLTAPDPLLYGSPTFAQAPLAGTAGGTGLVYPLTYPLDYGVPPGVTPGAVSVANGGTASYWPRLRIDGPVPNPTVTLVETGDWVHYAGTVAAGQWLDVDCANRRVLLNGQVSVRQFVTSGGSWLRVPPGGGSVSWTADGADPAALLSVWGYEGAWT